MKCVKKEENEKKQLLPPKTPTIHLRRHLLLGDSSYTHGHRGFVVLFHLHLGYLHGHDPRMRIENRADARHGIKIHAEIRDSVVVKHVGRRA